MTIWCNSVMTEMGCVNMVVSIWYNMVSKTSITIWWQCDDNMVQLCDDRNGATLWWQKWVVSTYRVVSIWYNMASETSMTSMSWSDINDINDINELRGYRWFGDWHGEANIGAELDLVDPPPILWNVLGSMSRRIGVEWIRYISHCRCPSIYLHFPPSKNIGTFLIMLQYLNWCYTKIYGADCIFYYNGQ